MASPPSLHYLPLGMKNELVRRGSGQVVNRSLTGTVNASGRRVRLEAARSLLEAVGSGKARDLKTPGRLMAWFHAPFIP